MSESKQIIANDEMALKEEGEWLLSYGKYDKALSVFLKLSQYYPDNKSYKYYAGICYLHLPTEQQKSIEYLEESYGSSRPLEDYYFYLAKAYFLNYRFDEAIGNFKLAMNSKTTTSTNRKTISDLIQNCKVGKHLINSYAHERKKITNLGNPINSEFDEYAPLLGNNQNRIFFTYKGKKARGGLQNIYGEQDPEGNYKEDIYSTYIESDILLEPTDLGGKVNTNGKEIAVGLSFNETQLIIYKDINGGDLYETKKDKKSWTTPTPLSGEINSKHFEGNASLSLDGKTLFFVSDRPGGYGGTDIYKATLQNDGIWGKIENLGAVINTDKNEDTPFIHASGKLMYFSSKGHQNMGGYDIFSTSLIDLSWEKPINIGYPINTTNDDKHFSVSPDGETAYFSSNRKGSLGGQDIYKVNTYNSDKIPPSLVLKGTLSVDNKYAQTSIRISDINSGSSIYKTNTNITTGEYSIYLPAGKKYSLSVEQKNKILDTQVLELESLTELIEKEYEWKIETKQSPDKIESNSIQSILDIDKEAQLVSQSNNNTITEQNETKKDSVEEVIQMPIAATNSDSILNKYQAYLGHYKQNETPLIKLNIISQTFDSDELSALQSEKMESVMLFAKANAIYLSSMTMSESSTKQEDLIIACDIIEKAIAKQNKCINGYMFYEKEELFNKLCKREEILKFFELDEAIEIREGAITTREKAQHVRSFYPGDTTIVWHAHIKEVELLEKEAIEQMQHAINQCIFHKNEALLANAAMENGFRKHEMLDSLMILQEDLNRNREKLIGIWKESEQIQNDSIRLAEFKRANGIKSQIIEDQENAIALFTKEKTPNKSEEPIAVNDKQENKIEKTELSKVVEVETDTITVTDAIALPHDTIQTDSNNNAIQIASTEIEEPNIQNLTDTLSVGNETISVTKTESSSNTIGIANTKIEEPSIQELTDTISEQEALSTTEIDSNYISVQIADSEMEETNIQELTDTLSVENETISVTETENSSNSIGITSTKIEEPSILESTDTIPIGKETLYITETEFVQIDQNERLDVLNNEMSLEESSVGETATINNDSTNLIEDTTELSETKIDIPIAIETVEIEVDTFENPDTADAISNTTDKDTLTELSTAIASEQILEDSIEISTPKAKLITRDTTITFVPQKADTTLSTIDEPQEKTPQEPTTITNQPLKLDEPDNYLYEDVLFDFDKYHLRSASKEELNELYNYLSNQNSINIELAGHADAIGEEQYNLKLSEKRVQEAAKYLIEKGIKNNRIKLYAYGEKKPKLPNNNINGADNPDNRQQNRRVELSKSNNFSKDPSGIEVPLYTKERDAISLGDIKYKVQVAAYQHAENYNNTKLNDIGKLEDLNIKGITRFTIGNFRTLQDARDFKKEIIKRGSSDAFITAEVNGERKYLFELTEENEIQLLSLLHSK